MSLERFREALEDISREATRTALCIPYYLTERTPLININLARDLWEWYCDAPNPYPEEPEPPFEGGQCECVLYAVNLTFERPNQPPNTFTENRNGPIGDIVRVPAPTPSQPDRTNIGFFFGGDACGGRQFRLLASFNADDPGADAWGGQVNSATRLDGLPDDCGTLPPPPPPPIPDPPPFPIPLPPVPVPDPDNPGGPDFIFSPRIGPIFIGPRGNINVPVEVNIDGPDVNVNIPVNVELPDFSPTINIGGGGGDEGPSKPEVPCCEPAPDLPEPPEDEPEPPDEEPPPLAKNTVVRGAIVTIANTDDTAKVTIIGQGLNAPTLFIPRLGNLYFRFEINNRRYWSRDIEVRVDGQFTPAPAGLKVVGAVAVGDPGIELTASVVTIVDAAQN